MIVGHTVAQIRAVTLLTLVHLTAALKLANQVKDAYLQAIALIYAGAVTREHGYLNDALKMLQIGLVKTRESPGPGTSSARSSSGKLEGWLWRRPGTGQSQTSWLISKTRTVPRPRWRQDGSCGRRPAPTTSVTWTVPPRCWRCAGGHLDAADPLAATSVGRWEGVSRYGHAQSSIVLAVALEDRPGRDAQDLARMARQAVTAS